ncbi:voltage-gated potassium channel [Flagellimonas taeanensis]|uniref:Voltage-gated potassium channel n=1 Tax=Flagellimonas taeanensis TaxID=1005926 RepID=A0A1M7BXW8_9FLAO|nr:ion transporter [Allomuricauda taeanensis]MEE1964032.1 ion transporter [Allomuricauda taeanensis]SFC50711.1 voltage-gated potassium channel [Allomuricauda taeanensis]SHL59804.1 voltage-gated potassium channel [Allomuricauda taeanensis]
MKAYRPHSGWKSKLHEIIYEADTPAGKLFDIVLFFLIILSVILVMLESIEEVDQNHHRLLLTLEWCITIFFSLEYIARLISIKKPWKYVFSFYGIIDFLSTIPLYLSYILAGSQVLLAVRAFRLLRVFRILKLVKFIGEASQLQSALKASRTKIAVFIYVVLILSVILGTLMYLVEGDEAGFTSIPRSIYWTIVTLTTVGYGDIAPQTPLGQFLATVIMILGYGIIAVPTGIVTAEFSRNGEKGKEGSNMVHVNTQACPNCSAEGHRDDATHCYNCGHLL